MITLLALPDTANGLVDYFSGKPVIVCRNEKCLSILPYNIRDLSNVDIAEVPGVRLLPVSTIAGEGIVFAFSVDKIIIRCNDESHTVNALVGVMSDSRQEYDAIFNPKLIF